MFKRGDKIRCIKAYFSREVEDILTLTNKDQSGDWRYEENTLEKGNFVSKYKINNWELAVENFQVGDTISLDEDITVRDILENGWGHIEFSNITGDLIVQLILVREKALIFKGGFGSYSCRLFKLVDRPIKVKEMTIAELEAQLGYPIKVVK